MKNWYIIPVSLVAVLVILAAIPMMLVHTLAAMTDDRPAKDLIFEQVRENEQMLARCVETGDYQAAEQLRIVKGIDEGRGTVDFDCGGAGFGPQTAYRGFFYSESDDLYAVWCAPNRREALEKRGAGWYWHDSHGDNQYYVEHICGHFYYYEASF